MTAPPGPTRRDVLGGLGSALLLPAAASLSGCFLKRPPPPAPIVAPTETGPTEVPLTLPPPTPRPKGDRVRFGWRWVPGVPFVYESKVGRSTSSGVVVRAEAWSYTPLTLDPSGLLTVHGELVGFGASVVEDGQALPESTLRDAREIARDRTPTDVDLGLRLNGRLVSCSQTDFAEALPHRLLGMHLPADPVAPGATWSDTSLALVFAQLIPVEMPIQVEGRTTYQALDDTPRGYVATLEHRAVVRTTDGGPRIELRSTIQWDTEPGAIARRTLEARVTPDVGPAGLPVGVLRAEIVRQKRPDPILAPGGRGEHAPPGTDAPTPRGPDGPPQEPG